MLNHKTIQTILYFGSFLLIIGIVTGYVSFLWLLVWILLGIALTAWGSFSIQRNYFLQAIHHNSSIQEPVMALTFDDGPHPNTEKVLDLLKQYQMKATFFCIGKEIQKYPEIARRIIAEGHVISNHTFSHSNKMGFLSTVEVTEEITQTNEIIFRTIHHKPALFRPPFGVTNPNIAKAVQATDMHVIGWNIRSLDTKAKSSDVIMQRVVPKLEKGAIVLLHDNRTLTVETLEQLLQHIQKKNLQSVTVPDLLKIKAYKL